MVQTRPGYHSYFNAEAKSSPESKYGLLVGFWPDLIYRDALAAPNPVDFAN